MTTRSLSLALVFAGACITDFTVPEQPPAECNPERIEGLLEQFPICDLGVCGGGEESRERGRCVEDTRLGPDQLAVLAPCADGLSHCVPADIVATLGRAQPPMCASIRGFEGRCTSICLPDVQANASLLPQDVCAEGNLCVPCYDPLSGDSTGACESNECDMPVKPKQVFQGCCAAPNNASQLLGKCLPTSLIPDDREGVLERKECSLQDDLCVPTQNTDPDYKPPRCTNDALLGPGACISICVPDANDMLFRESTECPPHTNCVPCNDPLGQATGACS